MSKLISPVKVVSYRLLKKDIPLTTGRSIEFDVKVGGVKLVYQVVTTLQWEINLKIFKFYILRLLDRKVHKEIYLRPFKHLWDTKRNHLPHNFWGKKNHPLTSEIFWVRLQEDYKEITDEGFLLFDPINPHVKDHKMQAYLRQHEDYFYFIY